MVKKLYNFWFSGQYYKYLLMIIYDHNDNGQYYKPTILASLALDSWVNYDHEVWSLGNLQTAAHLYDRKTFIARATARILEKGLSPPPPPHPPPRGEVSSKTQFL